MSDIYDLASLVKKTITEPSERTKQQKIGPSSLGSECAYCVARIMSTKITGIAPKQQSFSLYPWIGTAVHYYLEHLITSLNDSNIHTEMRVLTGAIYGWQDNIDYGTVKGTADLYSEKHKAVLDYKVSSISMIRKYKKKLSTQYKYQGQLYAKGVSDAGYPVDTVGVLFIPRDSMRVEDITLIPMPYEQDLAESALRRAERIWNEYVIPTYDDDSDVNFNTLASADDCFTCGGPKFRQYKILIPGEN